jgi:hypothetical protein
MFPCGDGVTICFRSVGSRQTKGAMMDTMDGDVQRLAAHMSSVFVNCRFAVFIRGAHTDLPTAAVRCQKSLRCQRRSRCFGHFRANAIRCRDADASTFAKRSDDTRRGENGGSGGRAKLTPISFLLPRARVEQADSIPTPSVRSAVSRILPTRQRLLVSPSHRRPGAQASATPW